MTPPPTVSVVMAACDVADVIDDAIASVAVQTGVSWELLVVDDASEDATPAIARTWLGRLGARRMRLLRTERRAGAAHARNLAIADARGSFLAIADADDISLPHRLKRSVAALTSAPDVAAVGGQVDHFWGHRAPQRCWHFPCDPAAVQAAVTDGRMPLAHPATVLRTSAVRAVGGYDEQLLRAQDLDLLLRLGERYRLVGLDETLVHYRRNPRLASAPAFFRNQLYAAYVRERHRRQRGGLPVPSAQDWFAAQRLRPVHLGWLGLRYVKQLALP